MELSPVIWRKASYSGSNGGACVEVGVWRKATYSGGNGGACVEVGVWQKSSYSGGNGGNCVEVSAALTPRVVCLVRDTKDRDGARLAFTAGAWDSFVSAIKDGTAGSF
jgi:Domain of unknown function (DUF397)